MLTNPAQSCSDCGPPTYSRSVAPGETYELVWDRRAYHRVDLDPTCTGRTKDNGCQLPILLTRGVYSGVLDYRPGAIAGDWHCDRKSAAFSADLSGDELTITLTDE